MYQKSIKYLSIHTLCNGVGIFVESLTPERQNKFQMGDFQDRCEDISAT